MLTLMCMYVWEERRAVPSFQSFCPSFFFSFPFSSPFKIGGGWELTPGGSVALAGVCAGLEEPRLLHWGACLQDRHKCATVAPDGRHGQLWGFESCRQQLCLRCLQHPDRSTETQVGVVGAPCAQDTAAQAAQCAQATYRPIYAYGAALIDLGAPQRLNCIQAARDAGFADVEATPGPGPDGSDGAAVYLGSLSFGGFIAVVVVGGAFLVALLVGGVLLAYRYKKRKPMLDAVHESETYPLSPPKKTAGTPAGKGTPGSSKPSPTSTTQATPRKNRSVLQSQILEQAVDDLV